MGLQAVRSALGGSVSRRELRRTWLLSWLETSVPPLGRSGVVSNVALAARPRPSGGVPRSAQAATRREKLSVESESEYATVVRRVREGYWQ